MRDTWYVLEDGSTVHPSEVSPNGKGRLAHKNGLVKMRDAETPMTSGVDVDEHGELVKPAAASKEAKPDEAKAAYKTRDSKAK